MQVKSFIGAAVAALALATSATTASAANYNVTLTGTAPSFSADFTGVASAGGDTFTFNVGAGKYNVDLTLVSLITGIDWSATNLNGVAGTSLVSSPSFAVGTFSFTDNTPFVLTIGNTGVMPGFSSYTGSITAYQVTPVPEPETAAMLLAGLGVMATIARRRNKRVLPA